MRRATPELPITEEHDAPGGLFAQPWWLEAESSGGWGEARVYDGERLAGRLPFIVRRRFGLTLLTQPRLARDLGPWVRDTDGGAKKSGRLAVEKRVMTELIQGLPRFDVFQQSFSPSVGNWLPFYWCGFQATLRYTYRLPELGDLDRLWERLSSDHRRKIRRARDELEVVNEPDLDGMYRLLAGTFERQGLPAPYEREALKRVDAACEQRDARRMFFAVDSQGRVQAALYLVWDSDCAYSLIRAHAPHPPGGSQGLHGALRMLDWEAIRFASTVTGTFDFTGSMIEPIERVLRGFGADQTPYLRVTKVNRWIRPLWSLRNRSG